MSNSTWNYGTNLIRLLRGDSVLRPLAVTYLATTRCNLNCAYCEDFGARRNEQNAAWLPLEAALDVLRAIRSGVDRLILSGGESLLHPDIVPLVAHARRQLRFRHITLLTNGLLLPEREEVLPFLQQVVISLDSISPETWHAILNVPRETAETILDNVRAYARRQREFGFRLVVNCVILPETLGAGPLGHPRRLVEFCVEHGLLVSFSPQSVNNWPRYELLVSEEYRRFVREIMDLKRHGAPILGSMAYLRDLLDLRPKSCYPALVPRIAPGGELIYPCWPVEREGSSHGGRPCNLRKVPSWPRALADAVEIYGPPPRVCSSCYQQCYAEPSLMQARPWALAGELLRYRAARRGGLASYAPG
jgi:MoaA/NifB/PqqE/SkfB family radical SAM enzyme